MHYCISCLAHWNRLQLASLFPPFTKDCVSPHNQNNPLDTWFHFLCTKPYQGFSSHSESKPTSLQCPMTSKWSPNVPWPHSHYSLLHALCSSQRVYMLFLKHHRHAPICCFVLSCPLSAHESRDFFLSDLFIIISTIPRTVPGT